jgi:RDD family
MHGDVLHRHGPRDDTRVARKRPPPAGLGLRIRALFLTFALVVVTLGVGWLVWSVLEWRGGRTASFHLTGLRVVRRSDGSPIGLARSLVRNALLCTLFLVPTIAASAIVAVAFVMGASPPDDLLREPRAALWDRLTDTEVVDERRVGNPRWPGLVPIRIEAEGVPASMN